jgi:hypothetical protein
MVDSERKTTIGDPSYIGLGYQPNASGVKVDPKTGMPPIPRGGSGESGRRDNQSIRNESPPKHKQ